MRYLTSKIAAKKAARANFLAMQVFGLALALSAGAARSENFHGLACYDGCANLKAGYNWAQTNDNRDINACFGHGTDYEKGCSMYVYEAGPAPPPPKKEEQDRDNADDHTGSEGSSDSPRE